MPFTRTVLNIIGKNLLNTDTDSFSVNFIVPVGRFYAPCDVAYIKTGADCSENPAIRAVYTVSVEPPVGLP